MISPITNQTYGSIELIISNLKQKIVDLKITPLNTLKLDIKQLNKNQYDFILSSLLNMNNNTNKKTQAGMLQCQAFGLICPQQWLTTPFLLP